ncbi:MAG: DUF2442 domain-containing protein [Gammaproteobacteria bacterium]
MATPDWLKKELRVPAAREAPPAGPRAAAAKFLPRSRALQLEMTNGVVIRFPVELIPGLAKASVKEIRAVEVAGRGGGLHWADLDLDLSVTALVSSALEGHRWMSELGRAGGRQSSDAKAAAARKNGRKGGRPRSRAAEPG